MELTPAERRLWAVLRGDRLGVSFRVLRFWNQEVMADIEIVLRTIRLVLESTYTPDFGCRKEPPMTPRTFLIAFVSGVLVSLALTLLLLSCLPLAIIILASRSPSCPRQIT